MLWILRLTWTWWARKLDVLRPLTMWYGHLTCLRRLNRCICMVAILLLQQMVCALLCHLRVQSTLVVARLRLLWWVVLHIGLILDLLLDDRLAGLLWSVTTILAARWFTLVHVIFVLVRLILVVFVLIMLIGLLRLHIGRHSRRVRDLRLRWGRIPWTMRNFER